ncbi:hypothetical protein [Phaeobacter inhibens]|uniref:Uncharacterized protein n=1 Tax=Phaeobacter inhibens TaxID=221822 RepID=A0A2I7K9S2_9RHOB|nr:hypothetical protein [Phaeobacter inhibens]AUQ99313.1 hypothetical protein PhaeoP88_01943 [Phaeobacter inhibens]
MTDIKKQLSNVAFGGSWSEEILNTAGLNAALSVIFQAADDCVERDVATAELDQALEFIRTKVGKGSQLAAQFLKAVRCPNQDVRKHEAMRIAQMINRWSGR